MDRRYRKRMARHWLSEERRAIASIERLDVETWFDLWHTHPDWDGKGNRCPENRAAVAEMTYRLLRFAEQRIAARKEPIQVFATICADTADNAVYLHSGNPNGTPFPHPFEGVRWGVAAPAELSGIFDAALHEVGWLESEASGDQHILRSRHAPSHS